MAGLIESSIKSFLAISILDWQIHLFYFTPRSQFATILIVISLIAANVNSGQWDGQVTLFTFPLTFSVLELQITEMMNCNQCDYKNSFQKDEWNGKKRVNWVFLLSFFQFQPSIHPSRSEVLTERAKERKVCLPHVWQTLSVDQRKRELSRLLIPSIT